MGQTMRFDDEPGIIDQSRLPSIYVWHGGPAQIVTPETLTAYVSDLARRCNHSPGYDHACMACRDAEALTQAVDIAGAAHAYPKT